MEQQVSVLMHPWALALAEAEGAVREGAASAAAGAQSAGARSADDSGAAAMRVLGDTVNLAARLEAHTKVAGRTILVDGATSDALGAAFATDALGEIGFKGKAGPTAVFALGLRCNT